MASEKLIYEVDLNAEGAKQALTRLKKGASKAGAGIGRGLGKGIDALTSKIVVLGGAFVAAFGAKKAIEAAAAQELAVQNLNTALKNAGNFTEAASKDIQNFATALQSTTTIGDEVILQQVALAQAFGFSAEKSKVAAEAALNLSVVAGIALEEATRRIGRSISGSIEDVAKFAPEIKNLSKAQLAAGGAADILAEKLAGAAASVATTFTGRVEQLTNNFGDLLEGLGQFITKSPLLIGTLGKISEGFADTAKFLKSFTDNTKGIGELNDEIIEVGQAIITWIVFPIEQLGKIGDASLKIVLAGFQTILGGLARVGEAVLKTFSFIGGSGGKLTQGAQDFFDTFKEQAIVSANEAQDAIGQIGVVNENDFAVRSNAFLEQFRTANQQIVDVSKNTQEQVAMNTKSAIELSTGGALDIVAGQLTFFADEILPATQDQMKSARDQFKKDFEAIGKSARDTVGRGIGSAFAAFGAALVNGENALEAFGKAFLKTIASGAVALGTEFILRGIAYQFVPGLQALGPPLIGAGAALATFGGALGALSGGGASGGSGGGAAGGAQEGGPTTFDDGVDVGEGEIDQKTTQVAINVEGTVLDPVAVGLQISEILSDTFEATGTKVVTV